MVNGIVEGFIINGGLQVVNEGGLVENLVFNDGGIFDVWEKGSVMGIQQSSQGVLVVIIRVMWVIGICVDGVVFSIEQGVVNNILLVNGGVLIVELDIFFDKIQVNMGGWEIVKIKVIVIGMMFIGGE